MNRRTFLASTVGLGLAALAAGCQTAVSGDLTLALLAGSVPVQLIQAFQRQQAEIGRVAVLTKDSLLQLYALLQTWQAQSNPETEDTPAAATRPMADWVTQADYWLASAIQQELIQPIDPASLERWAQLPTVWPQLVRRDRQGGVDPNGSVWGIPYRWTGLAILYDSQQLKGSPIQSWNDLLQPALAQRLLLPDHPRLVLGLGLKALNASANQEDPAAVAGLADFLTQLHGQVRWYSSEHTLKTLVVGDAVAMVGWLDTMLPVLNQYRNLRVAIPNDGTLASADLWVQPSGAPPATPLATDWLNFCLEEDFATQMAIYTQGLSPWLWGAGADQVPDLLQPQAALFTQAEVLERSEFLYPLSPTAQANYDALWQRMRTGMA
jgi:putative spermidine/putrescine transport system substrate-binding protein